MINKVSNKKIFLVWALCVFLYLVYVWASDISFKLLVISVFTNICILLGLIRSSITRKIKNPVEYVKFNEGNLLMGDLKIPTSKIQKVALDSVGEDGYFSLPYNPISPVGVPYFVFSAEKITSFKSYLNENIKDVEFIT